MLCSIVHSRSELETILGEERDNQEEHLGTNMSTSCTVDYSIMYGTPQQSFGDQHIQ